MRGLLKSAAEALSGTCAGAGTIAHHNHVLLDYANLAMGGWDPSGQGQSGPAANLGALFKGMFEPLRNRTVSTGTVLAGTVLIKSMVVVLDRALQRASILK